MSLKVGILLPPPDLLYDESLDDSVIKFRQLSGIIFKV
jgi:hypothetical protein